MEFQKIVVANPIVEMDGEKPRSPLPESELCATPRLIYLVLRCDPREHVQILDFRCRMRLAGCMSAFCLRIALTVLWWIGELD
jgi:hypothetical protein